MRLLLLLLACVAAASAGTLHFQQHHEASDDEWASFKTTFAKKYPTPQHETVRRLVWEHNLHYIRKHNLEADLGQHTYRLGMNEYGDLTGDEYKQLLLCGGVNASRRADASTFLPPSNVKYPSSVDWRTTGCVTRVKNQGQCGSCWAFSTTGSVEGQQCRMTGKLVALSEQNLVDCCMPYGNNGCRGGLMTNAYECIKAEGGIDTEASYPYTGEVGPCRFNPNTVGATVTGYVNIPQGSEEQLLAATATVGPISVAIDAGHPSFQLYRSGVYNEPRCSSFLLDHGVLVVGYGTYDDQDYWLVKNSWGPSWGLGGYVMMSRNRGNQCGIATQASYPLV